VDNAIKAQNQGILKAITHRLIKVSPILHQSLGKQQMMRVTCGIFDESKRVASAWGMGSLDSATIMTATG
jgi:hypothetical protein